VVHRALFAEENASIATPQESAEPSRPCRPTWRDERAEKPSPRFQSWRGCSPPSHNFSAPLSPSSGAPGLTVSGLGAVVRQRFAGLSHLRTARRGHLHPARGARVAHFRGLGAAVIPRGAAALLRGPRREDTTKRTMVSDDTLRDRRRL